MPIRQELLDELLQEYEQPEDLLGNDGLLHQLTKALVERALEGEMTHHLGYKKHDVAGNKSGNSRNGTSPKMIKSKRGQTSIAVPRDRNGTRRAAACQKESDAPSTALTKRSFLCMPEE